MKKRRGNKTYSIDLDLCEKWEKLMSATEDKPFSQCIEDCMRQDIEAREGNAKEASSSSLPEPLPQIWQRLKNGYTPVLDKGTQITELEAQAMRLFSCEFEREAARIKHVLRNNRIVVFPEISEFHPLEIDRNKGTMVGRERRKKQEEEIQRIEYEKKIQEQEAYELMQELPGTEAQFLSLQMSEEERQRKLRTPETVTVSEPAAEEGIVQENEEEYL